MQEFHTISKIGIFRKLITDGSGFEMVVPQSELQSQIKAAGNQLRIDYHNRDLTTIPVLEGGAWIHAQTTSRLPEASRHLTVSILAKRTGRGGGAVKVYYDWIKNHPDEQAKIRDRDCLIFDDVLDKGVTAAQVIEVVKEFDPKSIKTFFMIRKDVPRSVFIEPDYVLFDLDNLWLIGAGLGDDGIGRDRPHIACKPGRK